MSPFKTMLYVVLPQAFKNIIPEMANTFLLNGTDVKTIEVKSAPKFTKEYLPDRAKELGITVPDGYEEISAE